VVFVFLTNKPLSEETLKVLPNTNPRAKIMEMNNGI
jgi:hypothetical protein